MISSRAVCQNIIIFLVTSQILLESRSYAELQTHLKELLAKYLSIRFVRIATTLRVSKLFCFSSLLQYFKTRQVLHGIACARQSRVKINLSALAPLAIRGFCRTTTYCIFHRNDRSC